MIPETISHALTFAAGFLGGFEDDEQQEGVAEALKELRRLPMILQTLQQQAEAGMELAQFASYSEIVGGVAVNRPAIRECCDRVFEASRKLTAQVAV